MEQNHTIARGTPTQPAFHASTRGLLERLIRRSDHVFGLAFCAVVALNFISAGARYLGGHAFIGADEVQVYAMVWLIFLGAAVVGWRHAHLRMDVLVQKLGPGAAWLQALLESVLTAVVCAVMSWVSLGFVREMANMGQRSDGAGIPMWLAHCAPLVGFVLMGLCAVYRISELVASRARGQREFDLRG